ncbi:TaqI-like C-terminal specificity domain-containing protein [Rufibacter sp. XAAS-G3-1]|uniref:Eco57I restriction-modification methylase domain-containing protein n=1 Tax=Rufibacter sp. XAAS-G3-1 TaxID=2729134 RepID=UPI0015E7AE34|nr:TaqI-like C-terminal specificity domain-containing protein [Rufibacter sp. XAAS-G3-1]
MKEKELKHTLQQRFKFDLWKELLPFFFKKIEYFSTPELLFTGNDRVIEGQQVGTVKLDDGKQLAIIIIEVDNSIIISRNRQELRNIAIQPIDQNIVHGTLAFFFNKNQPDYRFSFIAKEASINEETGELIKGETKPKRYTYLLGPNEACTTPSKRLLALADQKTKGEVNLKQLKEVFSVEPLKKDFFKTYKAQYEKFWKHLANEENPFRERLIDAAKGLEEKEDKKRVLQEKPIRDFVKKLLGRIVFLHFLQKKGWMGCSPTSKDWVDGEPRFMQRLFEDFSEPEHFHSKCLTALFFNTLNSKRPNDAFEVKGLNGRLNGSRVPYLNGGLFEPEKNKATLEVDFPVDFFRDLLEFFEQYNFTIDENSPEDHEVGIDPEMLGHIFENLLEDNRDKGAFYTPKEIVQYMCKESLIQYLLNTFAGETSIEQFIRNHTVSTFLQDRDNALLLNQKLDDIKVCDPAIGSGAFPIGMLQEIFEAKRFIYPYLKTNKDFKPAEVKKNIIQNSIYGVDLEKGAVDIAQLRFWLSLVVEELNPHPLPNLDYKIMQGNSLLEQYMGIDLSQMGKTKNDVQVIEPARDLFGNILESQLKMTFSQTRTTQKIQNLIKQFFTIEAGEEKKRIREEINSLVLQHIEYNIELRENQLHRIINESGNSANLSKAGLKKYEAWQNNLTQLRETKTQLLKIQDTDERPYFLWHLYFMDVFEQGGFDVIIGNPPYIQLQSMGKAADTLQEVGYETFARTGDIYCLFYEKGFSLLKQKGVLSYITSNKWMRAGYGEKMRSYFASHTNPLSLIDFGGYQVFESATVDTNIMIAEKSPFQNNVSTCVLSKGFSLNNMSDYVRQHSHRTSFGAGSSWVVLNEAEMRIKEKIEKAGVPLKDWDVNIYRGILTGYNEAFIIDTATKDRLIAASPNSAEIIRPILRGRDIKKYRANFADQWMIFTRRGIDIERYPSIKEYLLKNYDFLKPKGDNDQQGRKPGAYKWFEIQDNVAYYNDFDKEKIVWIELTDSPKFALDTKGYYLNNTIFFMTGDHLKYLLAYLNSRLCEWYFDKIAATSGVGTRRWIKIYIDQICVPNPSMDFETKINCLVDKVISELNQENLKNIDRHFYDFFKLTEEEIENIEHALL